MVFADAWFYLALLDTGDRDHRRAAAWVRSFNGSIVTTRWVLLEVANGLSAPPFRRHFSALVASLETDTSVGIIGESDRLFQQGRVLYDQRPDEDWSLTDCISFAVMEEAGLREALTGDRHFAQAGFVALFSEQLMPPDGHFPATHWTLIARIKSADQGVAAKALDEVCQQYHYPLYCYIRRRGLDHHDAQDALHDFLAKLLRLGAFEDANAQKGHLRALLATALQRFPVNRRRDEDRRRHGLSVEAEAQLANAAGRYQRERFTDEDTPDRVFERKWAQELMHQVLRQLGDEYTARGNSALFMTLKPALISGGSLRGEDASALAASLGLAESTLRVAFSRLLCHFRTLLEGEVRQTVAGDGEVKAEIACLGQLFGGR